jgi:hypothetical protein
LRASSDPNRPDLARQTDRMVISLRTGNPECCTDFVVTANSGMFAARYGIIIDDRPA